MLIAESNKKKPLNLMHLTREEIEGYRKKKWFCPACKSEVHIKNGLVKRPHFSHKHKQVCDAFSENESEEHLKGKQLIAKNCASFGVDYQLEAYLPLLKQRPDVLINKKIAVEFQCSALSGKRFIERTRNYQKNGYEVLWIVGKKFHLKENNHQLQKKFMSYRKEMGFYYLELDVFKEAVVLKYFIQRFCSEWHFKKTSWPLAENNFSLILKRIKEGTPKTSWRVKQPDYYNKITQKWNQRLNHKEGRAMALQEFFYSNGLNLRQLDPLIFHPSFLNPLLEEDEWKIRFFIQSFFCEQSSGTFETIYTYVDAKIGNDLDVITLVNQREVLVYCVSLYLSFLTSIHAIQKENKTYHRCKDKQKCPEIKTEILWLPLKYGMINE